MKRPNYSFVFLGLSITSSWGNGHATTYRGLTKYLARRGHDVLFLERDLPFYADNRDMARPPFCATELYTDVDDLTRRFAREVREADLVVVGSYVPEGPRVIRWAQEAARGKTAFYDIDTPVTLRKLERGDHEYLTPDLIPGFDLYLSFTGGPTLDLLEQRYGARRARPLYCSVDPEHYFPDPPASSQLANLHWPYGPPPSSGDRRGPSHHLWDLGYLGTYSDDRQGMLDRLLVEPARRWPEGRFAVAGPQYPASIPWPANVARTDHVPPGEHRAFYNAQRYTVNVTRRDMVEAGHSPSVRLFEAAACGTPVISDVWPGLESIFEPGREILVARTAEESLAILRDLPEPERIAVSERARSRVLSAHTAAHRAEELETYTRDLLETVSTLRGRE